MEREEVIKGLRNIQEQLYGDSPFKEALGAAIEDVGKQIPRRPKIWYESMGCSANETFRINVCPCCGEELNEDVDVCLECYQRIDWRDVND